MSHPAVAAVLAMAAALFAGCGDDDGPIHPASAEPDRRTVQALFTKYFPQAYAGQDSALYARMLHPDFRFGFLEEDADSVLEGFLDQGADSFMGSVWSWGISSDLRSTSNMFSAPEVKSIVLNVWVQATEPYVGANCPECLRVTTSVVLRVVTMLEGDEGSMLTLAVDSPQEFIVRRDPSDSARWVLFRQIDKTPPAKTPVVQSKSWGGIKGRYR
jgi:hypothetical protein